MYKKLITFFFKKAVPAFLFIKNDVTVSYRRVNSFNKKRFATLAGSFYSLNFPQACFSVYLLFLNVLFLIARFVGDCRWYRGLR